MPQGRGESLVPQIDSAVNQAEQLRPADPGAVQGPVGCLRPRKAQQIDRLELSLVALLTSEQAQLQAI